jgi:hypothetical protein
MPARSRKRPAKLLFGSNPQISKGYGDEPVQAYIDAIPDWKKSVARWVDEVVTGAVPNVRKAVKYNSPLYGDGGRDDWFLGIHCFTGYVKVAFFRGAALEPLPPGESKQKHVRYLDIHEDDRLDKRRLSKWAKQASGLPGKKL